MIVASALIGSVIFIVSADIVQNVRSAGVLLLSKAARSLKRNKTVKRLLK